MTEVAPHTRVLVVEDDPNIVDSLKIIDGLLKTDTPGGPVWHRYNDDGYGEHDDGSGFDGDGRGRGWPLLTGEARLAARYDARSTLRAPSSCAAARYCG